jgi:hypothetical protein
MSVLLVRLSHAPGGEQLAVRGFSVDRTDGGWQETQEAECLLPREQEIFELARESVLSTGDPSMTARDAGIGLWDLIAEAPVGTWWKNKTSAAGAGTVRTVLDVVPDDLQTVPWELMRPRGRAPLFRNQQHPWVRARTPWQHLDEMPVPVSVLLVVGDTRSADLEVDEEIAAVHAALRDVPGRWNVEILIEPTLPELRTTLKDVRPDVLHFIAHGMTRGGEPVLAMLDQQGRQWPLRREDVDELPLPMPRLVLVNACRSANAPEGQRCAWTFADAFINRGAAAVVTMQGDIPSDGAAEFSRALYGELSRGTAVDVAVAVGRRAVSDHLATQDPGDERSWALPCMEVAADPDRILPVRTQQQDEARLRTLSGEFADVASYVDRSAERRLLWRALESPGDDPCPQLVLVTGKEQAGKSAVTLSAMMTLLLRGRDVVYVDFSKVHGRVRPASWLMMLRQIRHAIWYWAPDLPEQPRQLFDHELWYLRRYRDPEPWASDEMKCDDGEEFASEGDQYHETVERIFGSFRTMLRKVSAGRPLLVVLDGLSGGFLPDVQQWIVPHLLEPMVKLDCPSVAWVVVGTEQQLSVLGDRPPLSVAKRVPVQQFKGAELPRLAREYFARENLPVTGEEWWPPLRQVFETAAWDVVEFRTLLNLAAQKHRAGATS